MQESQETQVQSLGWEDPLKQEMATHCSTEEPGYSLWGHRRVAHDLATKQQQIAFTHLGKTNPVRERSDCYIS